MSKIHRLVSWSWQKHQMSAKQLQTRGNIIKCEELRLLNGQHEDDVIPDWDSVRRHPVLAITGDGGTLPADVEAFRSWKIPHDLYCVNKSMLFFQRQVDHWAAIDSEESAWFTQHVNKAIEPEKPILRHTIGYFPGAYDVWWEQVYPFTNDFQRRVFIGNTGYFAVLTALHMGYEKIVLLGIPMNHEPHWYEPEAELGPNWAGLAFTQWMDLVLKFPERAARVKSMGGYSAFILGHATRDWVLNAS